MFSHAIYSQLSYYILCILEYIDTIQCYSMLQVDKYVTLIITCECF